jgi:hypothetical protein
LSRVTDIDADLMAVAADAGLAALGLAPEAARLASAAALRELATRHGVAVAALVAEDRVA